MIKTQQMVNAYLNFANSTLKMGCYYYQPGDGIVQYIDNDGFYIQNTEYDGYVHGHVKVEKILGNPLMIGDILHFLQVYANGPEYFDNCIEVLDLWIEKQLPLQCQNDKCIDYVDKLRDKRVN